MKTTTQISWTIAVVAAVALAGCLEPESHEVETPEPDEELIVSCGDATLFSYTHDFCEPMEVAGEGACRCLIGYAWDGVDCVGVGGCDCVGPDCDSLTDTYEACLEAHSGCLEPEPDPCEAMDARGEGACRMVLGWSWNGATCELLGGCECVGDDCDALYADEAECLGDRAECLGERTPCGDEGLSCDPDTEVCLIEQSRRPVFSCVPIPEGCEDDLSCGCAGEALCTGIFDLCVDERIDNTVTCGCPSC